MYSKFIFAALLVSSSFAAADSFTIIRDNIEYTCEQKILQNSDGVADCAIKAFYSGNFSREDSTSLCKGATNVAPAECAIKVHYSGSFSREDSINLCKSQPLLAPRSLSLIEKESVQKNKNNLIHK